MRGPPRSHKATAGGRRKTSAETRQSAGPARVRSARPKVCCLSVRSSNRDSSLARYAKRARMATVDRATKTLSVAAFGLGFRANGYRQSEEVDESFCVFGVVPPHGKAGQVRPIQRKRRLAAGDIQRALPELQSDATCDALLRNIEESIERLTLSGKPRTVVDQLGVAHGKHLLQVRGFAVHS